jgi:hypothetical protein
MQTAKHHLEQLVREVAAEHARNAFRSTRHQLSGSHSSYYFILDSERRFAARGFFRTARACLVPADWRALIAHCREIVAETRAAHDYLEAEFAKAQAA